MLMNVIVRGSLYPDVAILIDYVMWWRASSRAKERDIKMTMTFYAVISHHRAEMMMDALMMRSHSIDRDRDIYNI
jgi:hypothetical protein